MDSEEEDPRPTEIESSDDEDEESDGRRRHLSSDTVVETDREVTPPMTPAATEVRPLQDEEMEEQDRSM